MSEQIQNGFYIAVVGSSEEAEPVRVQDGQWFSVGCNDPHSLDSIEIIKALDLSIPPRSQREEAKRRSDERRAWLDKNAELRERNYDRYREAYRRKFGWYPGHRRWA